MIASPSIEIVFTGGGTGGHLFPGLAVAEQIAEFSPAAKITFVGTGKDLERQIVRAAGHEYLTVRSRPVPRRWQDSMSFLADYLLGYRTAARILKERQVAAVVGLGGYASVPLARAAVRRRVPLVLLEQNATAGRATQWLARSATVVCTAFEGTALPPRFAGALHVAGNPVRRDFLRRRSERDENGRPNRRRQLLVLGGSNGARTLNQHLPSVLSNLQAQLADWTVVHQSGSSDLESTGNLYHRLGLTATVVPFLSDMSEVLAKTGLAVCRAGGTTLAELAVSRVPAILIPYPYATHDHQRKNADVFSSAGASLTIDERDQNVCLDGRLTAMLSNLLGNESTRAAMSEAMGRMARPNAARRVARLVARVAAGRTGD